MPQHPPGFRGTEEQRFWAKVIVSDSGCWIWTAAKSFGYGIFSLATATPKRTKLIRAHRWAYEYLIGLIPEGLEPDHLCRNRACVNPFHLEPVTRLVNLMRGASQSSINSKRITCIRGHESWVVRNGVRDCSVCRKLHNQARHDPLVREYMLRTGQPWAGKSNEDEA